MRLLVEHQGQTAVLSGLLDTGSRLREPFSGLPVIVCQADALGRALPGGLLAALSGAEPPPGVRLVPFEAVGGQGVLPAFRPERVLAELEGEWRPLGGVYLAVTGRAVSGEYQAIVNPDAIASQTKVEMRQ